MEQREKQHILTGGLILITVGILIILNKTTSLRFQQELARPADSDRNRCPGLYIRDLGGWVLVAAGVVLLVNYNWGLDARLISTYLLPVALIVIGLGVSASISRKVR